MTRKQWIAAIATGALVLVVALVAVLVRSGRASEQAAREEYAAVWQDYLVVREALVDAVATGEALAPDCATDTNMNTACDRLNAALEAVEGLPEESEADVSGLSEETLQATVQLSDTLAQAETVLAELDTENANVASEVARAGKDWTNRELTDPVRWAQQDVGAARAAIDKADGQVGDGGLVTAATAKADELQAVIDEISQRWESITITEGIDYKTALSGLSEETKAATAALEDAAGLSEAGNIDRHSEEVSAN